MARDLKTFQTKSVKDDITQTSVCIWLDDETNPSDEYKNTQNHLASTFKSFNKFNEINECIDFITDRDNIKVYLITSNTIGKNIIPLVHCIPQIESILIFYHNKFRNIKWTEQYKKVTGTFHDFKLICQKFPRKILAQQNDTIPLSIVSSKDVKSDSVNRQDPSFMYFQLIKETLLSIPYNESSEQAKSDMIRFCRNIHHGNQTSLDIVDEFEQNFSPDLSIGWYTRESFIYKVLNEALWMPKPDILYQLRYFLRHLHSQIEQYFNIQRINLDHSIIVYRGQGMTMDQVDKLKNNIGGFISFNNFLSTSLDEQVALNFLWGSAIGVLFEIHIDKNINKFPFVNIEDISFLSGNNSEKEILFSMGTVFRIVNVNSEVNDIYRIQLWLSSDIDQELARYTKQIRQDIRSTHSFLSLLKLMYYLSQYNHVDAFAELLSVSSRLYADPDLLDHIHNLFGLIYHQRGQLTKALDHYHSSLVLASDSTSKSHPKLAPTYNNMGSVYLDQAEYEKALQYTQMALNCQLNSKDQDISSVITYTANIARIYSSYEKYNEALDYHMRVLELQKQYLGENHSSIIQTYNTLASICHQLDRCEETVSYYEKAAALQEQTTEIDPVESAAALISNGILCLRGGQYKDALTHFNHAAKIQEKYFLPNNPQLAVTYNHIASAYYQQNQFEESLPYYLKSLEIKLNSLSDDHSSISTNYYNISTAYNGLSRWSDALEYAMNALESSKKCSEKDLNDFALYSYQIGYIYSRQEQYEKAIEYYKESLDFHLQILSKDDPSLLNLYYKTAKAYYNLKMYDDALIFYEKSLNIELAILPDNAETIATTYSDLATVYVGLKQYEKALTSTNLAIYQLRKTLSYDHPQIIVYQNYSNWISQQIPL